jgi:hypothetical protein
MNRRTILLGATGLVAGGAVTAASISVAAMGSAATYADAMAAIRAPLQRDGGITEAIRYATLAANGHNTQPWKFRIGGNSISILPDFTRRTPAVDPDDHHLFVSIGCASENLRIAASALGRPGELRFDGADRAVILDYVAGTAADDPLLHEIPRRQSTRAEFDGRRATAAQLGEIERAGAISGVDVVLITERDQIKRVRDLVIAGTTVQMDDRKFVKELKDWIRFNPAHALASGDGLFSGSSNNPSLPSWLGPLLFDFVFTAANENDRYMRQIDTSAGIAIFSAEKPGFEHWAKVGQACQRFALQATALGMKLSFINQPVEVASMHPELAALAGMPGRRPDIVMRFGFGCALPASPRRPVRSVIAS